MALTAYLVSLGILASGSVLNSWGITPTGDVLRGVGILGEGLALLHLAGLLVFRLLLPALRVTSPRILQDVVVGASWLLWIFVWLRSNRVELTGIVATSAVVTAVVGFSLQDTLGNILGGIALQFDRSVQVGDWIEVDGVVGRVAEIRWRFTSLETRSWETVVIPNSQLVKNRFLVLGRREGQPLQLRRHCFFNVDFRYPPAQVIDVVTHSLRSAAIPGIAREPRPDCVFHSCQESYGRYAVRYWLTTLDSDEPVDSNVRLRIYAALQRHGIPFSMPAQAVFVTQDTEDRRAAKARREFEERKAALRAAEIFSTLREEEIASLAARLVPTVFSPGEVIARQGAESDCLFLIRSGEVEVRAESGDGRTSHVATLGPGSFFGEMGLMTGEPRSATVLARLSVDAYRLDREAFHSVLQARPELASELSLLLARRRMELDAALDRLADAERREHLTRASGDLLDRIRRFFALG